MEVLELIYKLKENYEASYIANILYDEYPEFAIKLMDEVFDLAYSEEFGGCNV